VERRQQGTQLLHHGHSEDIIALDLLALLIFSCFYLPLVFQSQPVTTTLPFYISNMRTLSAITTLALFGSSAAFLPAGPQMKAESES